MAGHPHASPSLRGCGSLSWARASGQAPGAQSSCRGEGAAQGCAPGTQQHAPICTARHRPCPCHSCQDSGTFNDTDLPRGTGPRPLCFCPASTSSSCSGTGRALCQAQLSCPALPSEPWSCPLALPCTPGQGDIRVPGHTWQGRDAQYRRKGGRVGRRVKRRKKILLVLSDHQWEHKMPSECSGKKDLDAKLSSPSSALSSHQARAGGAQGWFPGNLSSSAEAEG